MDKPPQRDGLLIVIAATSGTGKSTVCQAWLQRDPQRRLSISYTTRAPRHNERDGREYHFIEKERFEAMIEEGAFLEWAKVHDHYYGTSRPATQEMLAQGYDVLLDIDVQGAKQIRQSYPQMAVLVFLLPPSWEIMVKRLRERGTESPERIERRLRTAREELPEAAHFDYIVENDDLAITLNTLHAITRAERQRALRMHNHLQRFLATIPTA